MAQKFFLSFYLHLFLWYEILVSFCWFLNSLRNKFLLLCKKCFLLCKKLGHFGLTLNLRFLEWCLIILRSLDLFSEVLHIVDIISFNFIGFWGNAHKLMTIMFVFQNHAVSAARLNTIFTEVGERLLLMPTFFA